MKSKFVKPFHPFLRQISQEIPENKIDSNKTKQIAKLMLEIIEKQRMKKKKGVGLAAPQIGIFKRIIVVDTRARSTRRARRANGKKKLGKLEVFINPEIIWKSKKVEEWYEGCFSTGNICGIVERSVSIKIKIFSLTGECQEIKYTGYVARIFQHEIDHLNGEVFIDHIIDPEKLHKVTKNEFPLYRKAWRNWPKKYPLPLALARLKKV